VPFLCVLQRLEMNRNFTSSPVLEVSWVFGSDSPAVHNLFRLHADINVYFSAEEMYQVRCEAQVDHTYHYWIFLFFVQIPSATIWHVSL
jgi:hypothetical protein